MKKATGSALLFAAFAISQQASAVTISGSVGGAPSGVSYLSFDDLTPGTNSATVTTTGPDGPVDVTLVGSGQVATGSSGGVYAAPFLSGGNGTGFGNADGPDETPYLSSGGAGGSATLTFSSPQKYFGLLWGSVDDGNLLEFFNGNALVFSVDGATVGGSINGDQGVNGTLYVNINDLPSFTSVKATSPSFAFEFDNVAYNQNAVPDGGSTVSLLGLSLLGVTAAARRLNKRK
ncbi:MAG: VPDSG-CTERM sorting domain-containing protein [Verrucomicrobiaceae bacterium]|nr:MAG: VPDSG-CTERM sorting domain-containing protein [Verrucomicrobiaceae bacterium]